MEKSLTKLLKIFTLIISFLIHFFNMLGKDAFTLACFDPGNREHLAGLEHVLALERAEGWEIITVDLESIIKSKQTNLYLILVDEECVGSISLLFEPIKRFVGVGAFIIDPSHRGKGLGTNVLKQCLAKSGADLAGLLTAPERTDFYKRLGFKVTGRDVSAFSLELPEPTFEMSQFKLSALSDKDKARIVAYDQSVTGLFRGHLLLCLLEGATVAVGSYGDDGKATGYALARPFTSDAGNGFRVSLYADDASIFGELLGKTLNHLLAIAGALSISITAPTFRRGLLESRGFKYEGGAYPFLTTAKDVSSLLGDRTWGILMEEFC